MIQMKQFFKNLIKIQSRCHFIHQGVTEKEKPTDGQALTFIWTFDHGYKTDKETRISQPEGQTPDIVFVRDDCCTSFLKNEPMIVCVS